MFGLKGLGNACKRWDGDVLTGCNPTFASLLGYVWEQGNSRITYVGLFLGFVLIVLMGCVFMWGYSRISTSCQALQSYLHAGALLVRKG